MKLEQLRDHVPKPYLQERAAAILKIAAGQSGRQTAFVGSPDLLRYVGLQDPAKLYQALPMLSL